MVFIIWVLLIIILGMAELDNTLAHNRLKQQTYWNLLALQNLHSLSNSILRSPYPQLHTSTDHSWSSLLFLPSHKVKQLTNTFISQSSKYIDMNKDTAIDRLALYRAQHYQLNVMKYQFWTRVYGLKPVTRDGYESRSIVRGIVWKQRFFPYFTVILFSTVVNAFSGIAKLTLNKRLITFTALFAIAQLMVRIKQSDSIFYSIPTLPDPQLEAERQAILRESIVMDGRVNSYDLQGKFEENLEEVAGEEKGLEDRREILEVLGYRVMGKADLV